MDAPSCGRWILGAYGEAKFRAEEIVRRNNGKEMENGREDFKFLDSFSFIKIEQFSREFHKVRNKRFSNVFYILF